jgi:plastocyanin
MRRAATLRKWLGAILMAGVLAAAGTTSAAPSDCTAYVDRTAAGADRNLNWVLSISSNPARCMTVQVGQTVTWSGSFSSHPLINDGGDTPNPIEGHDATGHVTFTKAGTFGYICSIHATMTGAIQVVAAPTVPVPAGGRAGQLVLVAVLAISAALVLRRARGGRLARSGPAPG